MREMTDLRPTNTPEPDAVEVGLILQTEGLRFLLAEMQALAALLPGHPEPIEEEIEAGFDDMPV
jgi:hypothetical protein